MGGGATETFFAGAEAERCRAARVSAERYRDGRSLIVCGDVWDRAGPSGSRFSNAFSVRACTPKI